jgi:hypothetical protein
MASLISLVLKSSLLLLLFNNLWSVSYGEADVLLATVTPDGSFEAINAHGKSNWVKFFFGRFSSTFSSRLPAVGRSNR